MSWKGVFLFIGLICNASCTTFNVEDPKVDGVVFGAASEGSQQITVDERNPDSTENDTIFIARITGAEFKMLKCRPNFVYETHAEFVNKTEDEIYLQIDRFDYEKLRNIGATSIRISVYTDYQTDKKDLTIDIKNIDDELPTLIATNCNMNEYTPKNTDSPSCKFTIRDPDGFLDKMSFTVDDDNFKLEYNDASKPDDTTQESAVFLGLKDYTKLDYETRNLYTFKATASDTNPEHSPASVDVVVKVVDMPDMPPVWKQFKSVYTIPEEAEFQFTVSAEDGDYGIKNEINYALDSGAEIDNRTGNIIIAPIDRDKGNDQISINVTAYEVEDPTSSIANTITFYIQDIDDKFPSIITKDGKKLIEQTVDEGTSDVNIQFDVSDMDQGQFATYDITLSSGKDNIDYTRAFSLVPKKGFENMSISLAVLNSTMLDYESEEDWTIIHLKVTTTGPSPNALTDNIEIQINLNDVNDEYPIFKPSIYNAEVDENAPQGTCIATIKATDKDAADKDDVSHVLMGGTLIKNILQIEDLGGNIVTTKDNAFDFEKQPEIIVQVVATDKASQVATAQLTIKVNDINDEKPQISVSSGITLDENSANGYVLVTDITATDDDTTADLVFSIDWKQSYVTKNSRRLALLPEHQIINCETNPTDTNKKVTAKFTLIETQKDNTPDFETYDTLNVWLIVTDKNNAVEGKESDSVIITIAIIDQNDNTPIFNGDPENEKRQVAENAEPKTMITSVVATDGDINDNITYSIIEFDDKTPKDWVEIDTNTGSIFVKDKAEIDCDNPALENIKYNVTATDQVNHIQVTTITIDIIDINDEIPTMDPTYTKEIPEEDSHTSDNTTLFNLNPKDLDRTSPNNLVVCTISDSENNKLLPFLVDGDNNIVVDTIKSNKRLDRETQASYSFELTCNDNPNGAKKNPVVPAPKILITLSDINDNKPTIKNTKIDNLDESLTKGNLPTQLQFEDADDGINSLIDPKSLKITKIEHKISEDDANPTTETDLISITLNDDSKTATLAITKDSLAGYYGYLNIYLTFQDQGTDPTQENDGIVTLQILKYNFKEPKFTSIKENETFYLREDQKINSQLYMYNDAPLDAFKATDQQNDKFDILYEIIPNDASDQGSFGIDSGGNLRILKDVAHQKHSLVVKASYDPKSGADTKLGNASFETSININIDFFNEAVTDPVFDVHTGVVGFKENSDSESYDLPKAQYTKTDLPPDIRDRVYYVINGASDFFTIDKTKGVISLQEGKTLDFETTESYTLLIQSSNSDSVHQAVDDAKYTLTINVIDENDHPPVFISKNYVTTLLVSDQTTDKSVVQEVEATDLDTTSKDKLCYKIVSWTSSPSDLLSSTDTPFKIDDNTGAIQPKFTPKADLKGYFTLNVSVQDEGDKLERDCNYKMIENHFDYTEVTIYLVSSANLVQFNFENFHDDVDKKKADIKEILENSFGNNYKASVQDSTDNSEADTTRSKLPVYFVDDSSKIPIDSETVYKKCADIKFFRGLKDTFMSSSGLLLLSFEGQSNDTQNLEAIFKAWLIGVSVVLGTLVLLLGMAFFLKTRSLNQRINKLSSTKFGSQESGLNRIGVTAAPTTNKHAIEGSNPVFNTEFEAKEIDRPASVLSGDSDLIGVEDDDKFNYNENELEFEKF